MKYTKLLLMAAVLAVLAGCKDNGNAGHGLNEDSVNRILNQKDAEINNLLGTINDIQTGLHQITDAENRVNALRNSGNVEATAVDDIKENMALIQRIMDQNRERIESLKRQLDNSNINAQNLSATIETLQQQLEEKNAELQLLQQELEAKNLLIASQADDISSLNQDKETLTQDKANLTEANESKTRTIEAQDKDLNKAWYVFGTKKELKEHNILSGGDVLTKDFNHNYLTQIDIRKVTSIPLGSKKATLLTTHPASSYTLQKGADKTYTLVINEPTVFWSVSKYLVVQVR